ncbi:MAG: hypothetical protein MUF43_14975 [Flavobacterium sp.]|nr:hypothetical protein [Flavobacterium sp.]
MKTIRIIAVSLFFSFIFLGCGEEPCNDINNPKCPNYDPCVKLKKTTASFKIYDYPAIEPPSTWEWEDTDTVRFGVIFEADMTYDDVENVKDLHFLWKIGGGTYTGRTVTIGDASIPFNQNIDVTLIVFNSNVNKKCFPNDDGIDTIKRTFFGKGYGVKPAWFGIYRGAYEDNPKDSIDFVMHKDSVKVKFPSEFCLNEFSHEIQTYTSTWLYITDYYIQPPNKDKKCNMLSSAFFSLNPNTKIFTMNIYNDNKPNVKFKIMHGRRLKSL